MEKPRIEKSGEAE